MEEKFGMRRSPPSRLPDSQKAAPDVKPISKQQKIVQEATKNKFLLVFFNDNVQTSLIPSIPGVL